MAFMEWSGDLSVKVDEFDVHHKKLIDMINTLHVAMSGGQSREIINKILADLADYTKYHFAAEERRMKLAGFAGLAPHKAEHDKFVQGVLDFKVKLDEGNASFTAIKVMNFLRDWLVRHIQGTDKLYSAAFATRNVA